MFMFRDELHVKQIFILGQIMNKLRDSILGKLYFWSLKFMVCSILVFQI